MNEFAEFECRSTVIPTLYSGIVKKSIRKLGGFRLPGLGLQILGIFLWLFLAPNRGDRSMQDPQTKINPTIDQVTKIPGATIDQITKTEIQLFPNNKNLAFRK